MGEVEPTTERWFRREGDLLTTTVDNELMAMSIERGICYGLNRVGARVWALLDRPRSIADLCEALAAEFTVDPETCRKEVTALLNDLRREGLAMVEPHA